jgi:VWFA-related protein
VRKITAILLIAFYAATAHAQLVESIEVRVTNIDVVVTDRAGNPVTGLTRDDFEIYEDGKLQTLTNFYEIRDVTAPRSTQSVASTIATDIPDVPNDIRRRRILFFIDNYSIEMFRRAAVIRGIDKFLDKLLQPGDEAGVATWNRGLKFVQPFTSDHAAVRAAIVALSNSSAGGPSMQLLAEQVKSQCQAEVQQALSVRGGNVTEAQRNCVTGVTQFVEELYSSEKSLAASLTTMLTTMAGVDGKKVLVFAGAHLPDHPGEALFQWLENYFAQLAIGRRGISQPPLMNGARVSRSMTTKLDSVARQANANGVTLYMLDAADPSKDLMPDPSIQTGSTDPASAFANYTGTLATFSAMAQMTGGVALTGTNNFDLALQTLSRDLNSYYSLGYRPTPRDKEGDRAIVVKCKRPGLTVRSRRSYVSKTGEEVISDQVVANIFHTSLKSELPVTLTIGAGVRESGKVKLPIQVSIPASSLTMLPDGTTVVGGFDVYIAVADSFGGMSSVTKREQLVRVPAAAEAGLRKQPLLFTAELLLRKGEHTLSVAVVDRLSNATGFARERLTAR